MIKNIITLTANDLAIAFKNKTIFLIVFIPLFVFFTLKLVDSPPPDIKKIKIGLIQNENYSPVIIKTIELSDALFTASRVSSVEEGEKWVKEKRLDGLLLPATNKQKGLILIVLEKGSTQALSIVESFSALQNLAEGKNVNWIADIQSLQGGGIQKQTLPTWILMLVLLVGFIIIPAQVAEEKEKKLLIALLQTPMRETEWLIAKVLSGMILILTAIIFLHLLGNFKPENLLSYVAFILIGSFCFSCYGIFLGFLCHNQASARTLGVLFYLPHLIPSALSDFSQKLTSIATFLPSYQLYEPVKNILLNDGKISNLSFEWLSLLAVGLITFFLSYLLLKKRWLM